MPLFIWSILLTNLANLIGKLFLELIISTNQIVSQFFHNRFHIRIIGDLVNQVKCLLFNLHVMVFEALCDS